MTFVTKKMDHSSESFLLKVYSCSFFLGGGGDKIAPSNFPTKGGVRRFQCIFSQFGKIFDGYKYLMGECEALF